MARALAAAYPESNQERGILVRGWQESLTERQRPAILLLFGAVLLVLVIACANVANMLLLRAAQRQGELAVRVALGASRGRIVQQLLTESLLLALCGGVAGLALSLWGIDATRSVLGAGALLEPRLDARVLGFSLLVALVSTFAFGLWPALRAARSDVAAVVKEGGRSVTAGRSRLRTTLVVLQVALSFTLLVGAALLGRSFLRVAGVEPGFDPHGVVTLQVALSKGKDPASYYARVLERVRSLPQVTAAGLTDFLPLSQSNISGGFDIEGKHFDDPNRTTEYMVVTPGYFETLRMHVVRGRAFVAGDTATSQKVAIVNQTMAKKWFGTADPIGQRIRLEWNDDKSWVTVVGVLADSRRFGLDGEPTPETYLPLCADAPFADGAGGARPRQPGRAGGAGAPAGRGRRSDRGDLRRDDHGRDRRRLLAPATRAARLHEPVRRGGAGARRRRALRGPGGAGGAADARARHPHRARRAAGGGARAGGAAGAGHDRRRRGRRRGRGAGALVACSAACSTAWARPTRRPTSPSPPRSFWSRSWPRGCRRAAPPPSTP